MIDIWRKRNPDVKRFTFRQKRPFVQTRLDYWFIDNQLERSVGMCDILPSITPDHADISCELKHIKCNDSYYGKTYWKFYNSLCSKKEFVDGMINNINEIKTQWAHEFESISLFWDFLKMKMREYAIRFSKDMAKEKKNNIEKLEKEIRELEKRTIDQF